MEARGRPPVLYWYWAFCAVNALATLAITIVGIWASLQPTPEDMGTGEEASLLFYTFLSGLMTLMYVAGPFWPRGKTAWMLGMVLMALDITTICCAPPAIVLMVFWMKPEARAWIEGVEIDPTQPLPPDYRDPLP